MIGGIKTIISVTKRYSLMIVSLSLILGGLIYLTIPYVHYKVIEQAGIKLNETYWQNNAASSRKIPSTLQLGVPQKISLPRLDINLNIGSGNYDQSNNKWYLDRSRAFYVASGQPPLNATAKPLIYGHNIPAVFRNLDGIAVGEPMYITNASGQVLEFKYLGNKVVSPSDGNVLNDVQPNADITLLTCTSVTFTNRKLLFFDYVGYSKSPTVAIKARA